MPLAVAPHPPVLSSPDRPQASARYPVAVVVVEDEGTQAAGDAALDRAWAEGEEDALRRAWDRYGKLVYTYCARAVTDRGHAADCAQETFVSAWRSRDRFDPDRGSLGAWLVGIARYRVLDAYRAAPRIPVPGAMAAEAAADRVDPEPAQPDALADRLLIADALETLPARARQVIELAFWSELSHGEIAAALDLPLGTVKSDVRRGLQRLRKHLEGGELGA